VKNGSEPSARNAPDIIYTTDINGAVTYLNPAWERVLGHAKEDTIGKYFVTFAKREHVKRFIRIFKRYVMRRNMSATSTGPFYIKMARNGCSNMSGAPNLDAEGNVIGIVGTFRDITKQRTLEYQLLHASKMGSRRNVDRRHRTRFLIISFKPSAATISF